jgi:hypothetical protein
MRRDGSVTERRFTEEEFGLILTKASELQTRPKHLGSGDGEGLSLEEIKAVAGEVGIDPALVDRAASLLPRKEEASRMATLAGGPTRFRLEHTIPRRLTEEDQIKLLDAVRASLGQHGKVLPGTPGLEWSNHGDVSQIYVTAVPGSEGTDVRVTANRDGAAILTVVFSTLGGLLAGVATGASLEPTGLLLGAGVFAGGGLLGLGTARAIWAATTRSMRRRLNDLMATVVSTLDHP